MSFCDFIVLLLQFCVPLAFDFHIINDGDLPHDAGCPVTFYLCYPSDIVPSFHCCLMKPLLKGESY